MTSWAEDYSQTLAAKLCDAIDIRPVLNELTYVTAERPAAEVDLTLVTDTNLLQLLETLDLGRHGPRDFRSTELELLEWFTGLAVKIAAVVGSPE